VRLEDAEELLAVGNVLAQQNPATRGVAHLRGCESNAVFRLFGCVPSRGSLGNFLSSEVVS
jgi:hypothetical protein